MSEIICSRFAIHPDYIRDVFQRHGHYFVIMKREPNATIEWDEEYEISENDYKTIENARKVKHKSVLNLV